MDLIARREEVLRGISTHPLACVAAKNPTRPDLAGCTKTYPPKIAKKHGLAKPEGRQIANG
jgi:hypothetical protein